MTKNDFENSLIFVTSILFYGLFWQEKMGLNVLLFTALISGMLFLSRSDFWKNPTVLFMAAGTFVLAILVVLNNSLFSKLVYLFSFTAFIGFVKQKELRFLGYGFLLTLINLGEAPLNLFKRVLGQIGSGSMNGQLVWRKIRLSLIPLLVVLLFYCIYNFSNAKFREVSQTFWTMMGDWFDWNISFAQVLFYLAGLLFAATIFIRNDFQLFKSMQNRHRETLERIRKKSSHVYPGMISLKNEYLSGLILLFALNALLLIVNVLDIRYVWFNPVYELSPIEMSNMVHDGTNLLILALLLAMLVISYLFRKNLNFYQKNKALKIAGYIWVVQNGILAISVFIKNYWYIAENGLAYKRIGILIFLILVFAGLVTMFVKIKERKSFYFLLHRNAWIAYVVLVACSFINWDIVITNHNLYRQSAKEIDFSFLISEVSDKNIYLLKEYEKNRTEAGKNALHLHFGIERKQIEFEEKQQNNSWLSWNLPDYRNQKYLLDE